MCAHEITVGLLEESTNVVARTLMVNRSRACFIELQSGKRLRNGAKSPADHLASLLTTGVRNEGEKTCECLAGESECGSSQGEIRIRLEPQTRVPCHSILLGVHAL